MSHAKMLKTRRAKKRNQKVLAGIAKRAKKMAQKSVKAAGAVAAKLKPA